MFDANNGNVGGGGSKRSKSGGNIRNHQTDLMQFPNNLNIMPLPSPQSTTIISPNFLPASFHPGSVLQQQLIAQCFTPVSYLPTATLQGVFPPANSASAPYIVPRLQFQHPSNISPINTAFNVFPQSQNTQNHLPFIRGGSCGPITQVGSTKCVTNSTTIVKKRSHAIPIIDPSTNTNVLESLTVSTNDNSNSEKNIIKNKSLQEKQKNEKIKKVDSQIQTDIQKKNINFKTNQQFNENFKKAGSEFEYLYKDKSKTCAHVATEPMPQLLRFQSQLQKKMSSEKCIKDQKEMMKSDSPIKIQKSNFERKNSFIPKKLKVPVDTRRKNNKKNKLLKPMFLTAEISSIPCNIAGFCRNKEGTGEYSCLESRYLEETFKQVCCTANGLNFIIQEDMKHIPINTTLEGYTIDKVLQQWIQYWKTNGNSVKFSKHIISSLDDHTDVTFGISAPFHKYSKKEMYDIRKLRTTKLELSADLLKLIGRNVSDEKSMNSIKKTSFPCKTLVETKQIINVKLCLHEDVKLNESNDAWKPLLAASQLRSDDMQAIKKKIRGILNRLTEENFQKLSCEATKFSINTHDDMKNIMILIFEKSISEPNFSHLYARFCHEIFDKTNQIQKKDFIRILLNHTEEEFKSNVDNSNAIKAILEPINSKLENCIDDNLKMEYKTELEEKEYLFRRRAWGTLRLIGELFNFDILNARTVIDCLNKLLDQRVEEKLEYLCKLLTTVGRKLEKMPHRELEGQTYNLELNKIFNSLNEIVNPKKSKKAIKLSSRVYFMILDTIDLRKNQWNKGSTTVGSFPKRVLNDGDNKKRVRYMQNKVKNTNATVSNEKNNEKKTILVDANKLNFKTDNLIPLGNSSQFMWRQTVALIPEAPETINTNVVKDVNMINEVNWLKISQDLTNLYIEKSYSECVNVWELQLKKPLQNHMIFYILSEYLLLTNVIDLERHALASAIIYLFKRKFISVEQIRNGFLQFRDMANDIFLDIPQLWTFLFYFIVPLLQENILSFDCLWSRDWKGTRLIEKFLIGLVQHVTMECGLQSMRNLWRRFNLNWSIFFETEEHAFNFVSVYRYGFITDVNLKPHQTMFKRNIREVCFAVKRLLTESVDIEHINDFVNGNLNEITVDFVEILTTTLCYLTVITKKSKITFDSNLFDSKCIPVLRRYLDGNEKMELKCLYAVQNFVKVMDYEKGLLHNILHQILDKDIISEDTFNKWKDDRKIKDNYQYSEVIDGEINSILVYTCDKLK